MIDQLSERKRMLCWVYLYIISLWMPPLEPVFGGVRHRRLKPLTPTKPSSLSFRQSSALNGSPSYALFGTQPFQMPKVISRV